jgi:uncharacterized membrane protein YdjX (TVP38/TMEM64 family)
MKWAKLVFMAVSLIVISYGLAYLLDRLLTPLQPVLNQYAWLAYLGVFGVQLLCNLTIVAPVPIATAIMLSVATQWNPFLIALFAALGGTLGEISGYYAGYAAKNFAINESTPSYSMIARWINRWGPWAITFLAFQPILPFDIGGVVAGTARMPLLKFLPAIFWGKFPKYLILCVFGAGVVAFFKN